MSIVAIYGLFSILPPMLTVTAQNRAATETVAMLHSKESIPAVVYGPKHTAQSISIPAREFAKVWRTAGESTIITLKGLGGDVEVLIHEVQMHPLSSEALHVDFYAFDKTKKLTATIPLHFVGLSQAEKSGAVIIKVMHELTIEVLPSELPSHIDVDLALLAKVDDHITVGHLKLPASAEAELDKDEIIATAVEAKEEVVSNLAPDVIPAVAEAQAAAAAAAAAKPADPDKKKSQ